MTGLSDYASKNFLNYITGQTPEQALPSVWMALMTVPDTDVGTGGTEVSGGAYARVQVAGPLTAASSFTTASTTITMPSNPGWVVPGMSIYDTTKTPAPGALVGTVLTYVGTTLTLTAASLITSQGAADVLVFSAFGPATGSAPSSLTNSAAITFPTATLSWGTVVAFELRDAVTSGNLLVWDFLGNFNWLPFTMPNASGTVTTKAHGYASNDPIVFSSEYGGTLPTFSTGVMTGYTVSFAGTIATDTFVPNTTSGPSTPFVSTSSGNGMCRKIVQQSIPSGVTASFAANALNASGA